MTSLRARFGALIAAAAASVLLISGCAAGAPAPSVTPSPDAVIAPANARGFGLPTGEGAVEIALWTDLSCPHCQALDEAIGADLENMVADRDATLTIHPLTFVSAKRGDTTDWSTRAANALAAVLDAGEGDRLPTFYALLQAHQVTQDGAPADEQIIELAAEAGVTADISEAVTTQRFAAWATASNDHWLGRTIDGTERVVEGVPILVIGGQVFEIRDDGTDAERVRAAVAALVG